MVPVMVYDLGSFSFMSLLQVSVPERGGWLDGRKGRVRFL